LDSLHEENTKLYWNIVNELQGKSEKSGSCAVPSSTLVAHFKTLSELKSEFHNRYAQLSEQLNARCLTKKIIILTLVLSEKKFLNET
jgi:hypothetical protein